MTRFAIRDWGRATLIALGMIVATVSIGVAACSSKSEGASAATGPAGSAGGGAGGRGGKGARGGLEYAVQTAPLTKRQVRYTVTAPGSIEAFQQVQVTARVAGAVDHVSFAEGQNVTPGQVLASVETDRYEVAVGQAKAQVAKASANQKSAEEQLGRRKGASDAHPGLIPGEEIETHETQVETAKADVEAAKQALRVAELNLRDSMVKAPIKGIVQTRTVQQGQYLQPGAVLATILQRDPMLLRFQVTEQEAPRLKNGMKANMKLKESANEYAASITLVGGNADPTTRLVPVTAQVDATEHQYWLRPGAFCEVTVPIGDAREAIVVPSMAIQPTEKGNIVYVVEKNTAHQKVVELGMHTPDGGVEITRGVNVGDVIVVRGIEPLSDGAPVKVVETTTLEGAMSGDAGAPPPHENGGGADGEDGGAPHHSGGGAGGGGHKKPAGQ